MRHGTPHQPVSWTILVFAAALLGSCGDGGDLRIGPIGGGSTVVCETSGRPGVLTGVWYPNSKGGVPGRTIGGIDVLDVSKLEFCDEATVLITGEPANKIRESRVEKVAYTVSGNTITFNTSGRTQTATFTVKKLQGDDQLLTIDGDGFTFRGTRFR
jgi:hypothetical protein